MSDIVVQSFNQLNLSDMVCPMLVVYEPANREYPGMYVARLIEGAKNLPTNCVMVKPTYAKLLELIPTYEMFRIGRDPQDVPEIKEVWV